MNYHPYAGIGARETPKDVIDQMIKIGKFLGGKGYTLRSGGAEGADSAFETGANLVAGDKEIFLPWEGFNKNLSTLSWNKSAWDMAEVYHPHWENLKRGARMLQARNSCIILGENLDSPVEFVVCWTKGGEVIGGTGQALRIAKDYGIKIFNLGFPDGFNIFRNYLIKLKLIKKK